MFLIRGVKIHAILQQVRERIAVGGPIFRIVYVDLVLVAPIVVVSLEVHLVLNVLWYSVIGHNSSYILHILLQGQIHRSILARVDYNNTDQYFVITHVSDNLLFNLNN